MFYKDPKQSGVKKFNKNSSFDNVIIQFNT